MTPKSNLDLMRAVAVILVVFDHTVATAGVFSFGGWQVAGLGTFGVYLFFVHTCLVLMWSLERRPYTLDFYVRRIFRIYPLAMVTVLGLVLFRMPLVGTPTDPFRAFHPTVKLTLANLLLVQNLVRQPNAEGVLWSLPLEVQMYIVLPALFLFARKEEALWPFVVLWGLAIGVVHGYMPPGSGNTLLTVIPDFLPGVIAYVGFRRFQPRLPAWGFPILLGTFCAVFARRPSMPVGWSLCLLLGLALPQFLQLTNRSVARVSHTIAKYSYGIYLLHPWSILLGFHVFRGRSLALRVSIELASLVLLATAAYHLIEQPLIRLGSRAANLIQRRYDLQRAGAKAVLELT